MAGSASEAKEIEAPPSFLIVNPKKGKKRDIFKYLVGKNVKSGMSFLDSSDEEIKGGAAVDHRWMLLVSIIICRFLNLIYLPMKYIGDAVDFFLNLISQNEGLSGIFHNFFHGSLKVPQKDSETFLSNFGHVDGRIELYRSIILSEQVDNHIVSDVANIKSDLGNKYLMDLCVMSAKLAYENPKVVQNVVDNYWKMHFVAFYNCWNESQKQSNTQVFICYDKPKDANLIVVSFRGTETFNTQDMVTDLDFSWFQIPKVGKIHIGFLEALGLGNRSDPATFQFHLAKHESDFFHLHGDWESKMKEFAMTKAFYAVALTLKHLLIEHKNAKFVVTGHSLGGALAILFPSVLVIQEETAMLDRLLNVYTFGQPRIGDPKFAGFMEAHLNYPDTRYFRVVYCNDMIPRVPFDDELFAFKHFGTCIYYDSWYYGKFMEEEPNKNFFSLRYMIMMWPNAQWELLRSMIISYMYGPYYKETWLSTVFRLTGLLIPSVPAHSPVEYVNSVRLGREKSVAPFTSLKSFVRK
ncbi:triacylglycerol lipase OBL1-like [Euphorbia lathyris]|uniref:triacylglycerol lipase OBL1-like n=1 Tax=Euphorbia lathyris TaxID=212925 RepID=UPI0033134476